MRIRFPHHVYQSPEGDPTGGAPAPASVSTDATDDGASSGGDGADDLSGLKKALKAERERARQEEAARKQLEAQLREVGQVDPKLLDEARQRAREAEQQRLMVEQQTTIRLQEQERKYQELLEKKTSELQALATTAQRDALRVKTEREFLAAKGLVEASAIDGRTPFDYIWQLYGNQFAEDRNGLYLVDGDGMPRLDDETGKRISPAEFFAKLRKDPVHGMHFQPEYGSGSGSRAGRDGRVMSTEDLSKVPTSQLFRESFGGKRRTA
jgi:hypothetical protein